MNTAEWRRSVYEGGEGNGSEVSEDLVNDRFLTHAA